MAASGWLVINAGSSSLKFALFSDTSGAPGRNPLLSGRVERLGEAPTLIVGSDAPLALDSGAADPFEAALARVLGLLDERGHGRPRGVAHRVVHGGMRFSAPVIVEDGILCELARLNDLAPLHQPHNLRAIARMREILPEVAQVAVFDTAFHRTMARNETLLAIPRHYYDEGVRRYGFHGLSYEYLGIALEESFGRAARGRVIAAHLGAGASLCAMEGLQSVATTMGFSTLDGLVMGTRPGALDPGVLLYLVKRGMTGQELEQMLYHQSGLEGISGLSPDMRTLIDAQAQSPAAREAVDLFVHRMVREVGALYALLGGLDMLVFTAGIGEHAPEIRRRVVTALAHLGMAIDERANQAHALTISLPTSPVRVLVIPTNEEWIAARAAWQLLAAPH